MSYEREISHWNRVSQEALDMAKDLPENLKKACERISQCSKSIAENLEEMLGIMQANCICGKCAKVKH